MQVKDCFMEPHLSTFWFVYIVSDALGLSGLVL